MSSVAARPAARTLHAFEAFGIELEYMVVRHDTLDVLPIAERMLDGNPSWSNELVAHVVELKNPVPAPHLDRLAARFSHEVRQMNAALRAFGACLMPGGMHPWMDPRAETRLWPHQGAGIYRTYDRIFDCRGHGWANLQSMHLNLPFADDREFARLHAAVRLALPILPALAASSPFVEGRIADALDYRLEAYRHNANGVPAMNGRIIPEPVASRAQYESEVLRPLYAELAPHDPQGVLRHEWANARGAIARFERNAIEIRVLDVQECPAADIALAAAVADLVQFFYEENRPEPPTDELVPILVACIRDAERARIDSPVYGRRGEAREVWHFLAQRMREARHRRLWQPFMERVLDKGPLARRMLHAVGPAPSRNDLARLYAKLCECLDRGQRFDPSNLS
jgi:gamma-glutamyl:cysteine ligase YbdK (ATP-grasp superfamily)